MIAAIGHSHDLDSADAIVEALDACAETLGEKMPQAGLLFAGIDHDHQALLDGIEARYPDIQLIGCTTHGEISSDGFAEDSVVLMLLHSAGIQFRTAVAENVASDPEARAQQVATDALNGLGDPVQLCIAVSESIGVNTTRLLGELGRTIGPRVPVCGGLAGDQLRFEKTYQFCNAKVYSDAVAVLLMAGDVQVSTGVASGWEPIGAEHRVTQTEEMFVHAIDGEPARDLWLKYFGTDELVGARHLIAVYPDPEENDVDSSRFYLSAPLSWSEDGALVMSPPIPTGARFRFANATRDQILAGTSSAIASARGGYSKTAPDAALIFSCAGRHGFLGTRVRREIDLFKEQIGEDVPTVGFYTYGEFCPFEGSSVQRAHGSTFVSVLIGSDE